MLNDILMLQIIDFQQYPRVYAQTHVNDIDVYKGSQWAVLNATPKGVYEYNGGPCE
jgi:hypothetical protein